MKLRHFSVSSLFNFIKKDDVVYDWALFKTSKYPFTIYYFASTFKFFMILIFFIFAFYRTDPAGCFKSLLLFFIFIRKSWKERFYLFFARICWFLIGKCCSLHIRDGQETGKITLFRKETLEKCKFMLALRKQHNLKYKNVALPVTVGSFYGFHLNCYKRFTALSATLRKDKDLIPTENSSSPPSCGTRSTSSNIKTKRSVVVFEKSCIIYLKKHKKYNQKK